MYSVQVFNICLCVFIVSRRFKSDKFHSEIIDQGCRCKRTSCSAADEYSFSFQPFSQFSYQRFNTLMLLRNDFLSFLFFSEYLCNTAIPFIRIAYTNGHNGMRIGDIVIFPKGFHKLISENFTDRSRSLCSRDLSNFLQ